MNDEQVVETMMRRRRISWCVAHDSHMSGDSGQCEAAEGELAPWDWEGNEAECREARAYLDLVPVGGEG